MNNFFQENIKTINNIDATQVLANFIDSVTCDDDCQCKKESPPLNDSLKFETTEITEELFDLLAGKEKPKPKRWNKDIPQSGGIIGQPQ